MPDEKCCSNYFVENKLNEIYNSDKNSIDALKKECGQEEIDHLNSSLTEIKESFIFSENKLYTDLGLMKNESQIVPQFLSDVNAKLVQQTSFHNETLYCENCDEDYDKFCSKCSMLLHIFDHTICKDQRDRSLCTIPKDILEIKQSKNHGVFALKEIPEGVSFGPFEGLEFIHRSKGSIWKIKDRKFITINDIKSLNWMQYIKSTEHDTHQNLIIYQSENELYYRSIKKINKHEELLIYFSKEQFVEPLKDQKYCPVVEEKINNIYACTYCCLGFSSKLYLTRHKTKCPFFVDNDIPMKGIVQCIMCKIYMDEEEYSKYHLDCCNEKHIMKNNLKSAQKKHNLFVNKKYSCSKCNFKTGSLYVHNKHGYSHVKPFKCTICEKKFSTMNYLQRHVLSDHIEEKTKNKKHGRRENGKYRKYQRYSNYKTENLYQCIICFKEFSQENILKKHVLTHSGMKLFRCEFCEYECNYKENLKLHVKNKHTLSGEKRFHCVKCKYQTNYKSCLINHFYVHGGTKPLQCEVCGKGFAEKSGLKSHLLLHSENKLFKCKHCTNSYRNRQNLNSHVRDKHVLNVGSKFTCAKCNYGSNFKSNFQNHLSMHENIKPFQCFICNKRFKQKCHLNSHSFVHTGDKQFRCELCGKEFSRKEHLKRHSIVHADQKPFVCETCNKPFSRKENLKVHVLIHNTDKKFICRYCDYRSNYKSCFISHFKTKHPNEPVDFSIYNVNEYN